MLAVPSSILGHCSNSRCELRECCQVVLMSKTLHNDNDVRFTRSLDVRIIFPALSCSSENVCETAPDDVSLMIFVASAMTFRSMQWDRIAEELLDTWHFAGDVPPG